MDFDRAPTLPAQFRPRELVQRLTQALGQLPVVVVTGLRQCGKTTLLTHAPVCSGRRYHTLDDYATLAAARANPERLTDGDEPVTIDEVQRCPELLVAIKRSVDRDRRHGRFLLSGSANLALLSGVSETLAGRAIYLRLGPFTRRELLDTTARRPFLIDVMGDAARVLSAPAAKPLRDEEVLAGGMPPIAGSDRLTREAWQLGYEQTYLERDLRDLAHVADLVSFRQLLKLSALRTAQVLNQSDLARDAKLSASTTARHLGLLEASFVIERQLPFLRNRASRVIKSPKIYLADSGIAAHLAEVDSIAPEAEEHLRGALIETYVAQNLRAILQAHAPRAELSYWHVQGRHEVDFVISWSRRHLAIEVKAATRFDQRDLAGLRAFIEKTRNMHAAILAYGGSAAVALGDKLFAVPISMLLA